MFVRQDHGKILAIAKLTCADSCSDVSALAFGGTSPPLPNHLGHLSGFGSVPTSPDTDTFGKVSSVSQ